MSGAGGRGSGGNMDAEKSQHIVIGIPIFVVVWVVGADLIQIIMFRYSDLLAESATIAGTILGIVLIYVIVSKYHGLLRIVVMWGTAALVGRWILTLIFEALGRSTGGTFI